MCSLRVDDIKKTPLLPLLHGFHASNADSNHVSLCIMPAVMATDFNFSFELNVPVGAASGDPQGG